MQIKRIGILVIGIVFVIIQVPIIIPSSIINEKTACPFSTSVKSVASVAGMPDKASGEPSIYKHEHR